MKVTRRIVTAFAVAALATIPVVGAVSPASADQNIGELTFYPGKGRDVDPMFLITPRPCPAETKSVSARIYGKGFPADGQIVVANSKAGISVSDRFFQPFQDTLNGFASLYGIKLAGPYKVVLKCQDRLGATVFGTFTGTITFSDPTHYTAKETQLIQPTPEPDSSAGGGGATSQPTPQPTSQPTSQPTGQGGATDPTTQPTSGATGSGGNQPSAGVDSSAQPSTNPTANPSANPSTNPDGQSSGPSPLSTSGADTNAASAVAPTSRPGSGSSRWVLLGLGAVLLVLGIGWILRGRSARGAAQAETEAKVDQHA